MSHPDKRSHTVTRYHGINTLHYQSWTNPNTKLYHIVQLTSNWCEDTVYLQRMPLYQHTLASVCLVYIFTVWFCIEQHRLLRYSIQQNKTYNDIYQLMRARRTLFWPMLGNRGPMDIFDVCTGTFPTAYRKSFGFRQVNGDLWIHLTYKSSQRTLQRQCEKSPLEILYVIDNSH